MAREQRKDVDYFPHSCTHGRKMHIIETKHGNDGYAAWFKLLEQLGKANNHYIDISDEMDLMFLTSIFKIDEEKTLSILNDLAKLGAIDKFLFDEYKIVFSHKFADSIQDAYRKRKTEMFQYSDILTEIKQKNGQSAGDYFENDSIRGGITEVIPKEKNSKVKEIKEKYSYKKNLLEFVDNEQLVDDFISMRKTKKAPLSKTAFDLLKNECDRNNFELEEALTISIQQNWQGFKVDWVNNLKKNEKEKGSAEKEKPLVGRMTETAIKNSINNFK
jgi:hypothetical protein